MLQVLRSKTTSAGRGKVPGPSETTVVSVECRLPNGTVVFTATEYDHRRGYVDARVANVAKKLAVKLSKHLRG